MVAAAEKMDGGGLRRKRTSDSSSYNSNIKTAMDKNDSESSSSRQSSRQNTLDQELASRFFLPTTEQQMNQDPLDIDMRSLLLQMNLEYSMSIITTESPTKRPTLSPTVSTNAPSISTAPTLTSCDNPGTCENRLKDQIYAVSVRVGTVDALDDPNSPQSQASAWILEECGNDPPIDPCTATQIILNEQRYALAVMYYSLAGDGWNNGAIGSGDGEWMSDKNYCEWGPEISADVGGAGAGAGSYQMLECDEFGNVLSLNMREYLHGIRIELWSDCFSFTRTNILISSFQMLRSPYSNTESNNMIGTIPPEIGVLVYLTSYISFFNAQTGEIPSSLGLMPSLQTFDVESNNMDGDLFKPEFYGLQEVVNFRASLNNFRGSIPTEIGQWTKLQNLWFAQNAITGTIPPEIGNCVDMGEY